MCNAMDTSILLDVLDRISRTLYYMLKPTHRQTRRKSRCTGLFPRDAKIPVGRRIKNDINFSTVKTPRRGDLVATRNHIYYIVFHPSKSVYTPYTRSCSMINYPSGPVRRRSRDIRRTNTIARRCPRGFRVDP